MIDLKKRSTFAVSLMFRAFALCVLLGVLLPTFDIKNTFFDLGVTASAQGNKTTKEGAVAPHPLPGCSGFTPPKRKLAALDPKLFKTLEPIQALISPPINEETGEAAEPDYKAAMPKLERVIKKCTNTKTPCKPYDLAQVYRLAAFSNFELGNVKQSIKFFKKVLEQSPNLYWRTEQETIYTIAQLHMISDGYRESLAMFDKWEKTCPSAKSVGSSYYAFRSQIYYQINDKKSAMSYINKAITNYEAEGKVPKEGWYRLKLAMFSEKEKFKEATAVMEKIIVHYPSMTHWTQLGSLYGLIKMTDKQLGVLDGVNLMGGLTKPSFVRNYASLLLSKDAPYPASKVLEKAVKSKVMENNAKNFELLAQAFTLASETDDAVIYMEKAAKLSDKSRLYSSLSAIYLEGDKYKESIDAASKAIKKNKFRNEAEKSQTYLFKAVAHMNLKQYDSCVGALAKVRAKALRTNAGQLSNYCRLEKDREQKLKASQAALKKA